MVMIVQKYYDDGNAGNDDGIPSENIGSECNWRIQ